MGQLSLANNYRNTFISVHKQIDPGNGATLPG